MPRVILKYLNLVLIFLQIQVWTETSGERNVREMTVQPHLTEALVTILIPYAMNKVQILAYNGAYNGPPSKVLVFRTSEGGQFAFQISFMNVVSLYLFVEY